VTWIGARGRFTAQMFLTAIVIGGAASLLRRQAQSISLSQIAAAVDALPRWRLAASAVLTTISFCALAAYDAIAVRLVAPGRVPMLAAAFAGAVSNAISNTLGFHAVTGSIVRYRIYRVWGLDAADFARVVSLSWLPLALGFLVTLAIAILLGAAREPWSEAGPSIALDLLLCGVAAGSLALLARNTRTIQIARFSLKIPDTRVLLFEMAIGAVETAATVGALYLLIPPLLAPSFSMLAMAFISAVLLGIISHAPGGLGVFEATMISILPVSRPELLAALILFRLIYNIVPFVFAVASSAVFETLNRYASVRRRVTPDEPLLAKE
jgi:uncharacterized membrane protein YbhN (UPF0104 family)